MCNKTSQYYNTVIGLRYFFYHGIGFDSARYTGI